MAQKSQRPLSPHLQIYAPQITWITSITHRFTGLALTVGTLVILWWLVAMAIGPDAYATAVGFLGSWFGQILLFGWTLALTYHFVNGLRHLVWDAGWGLELAMAQKTGWATVAATGILTVLIWIIAYSVA